MTPFSLFSEGLKDFYENGIKRWLLHDSVLFKMFTFLIIPTRLQRNRTSCPRRNKEGRFATDGAQFPEDAASYLWTHP